MVQTASKDKIVMLARRAASIDDVRNGQDVANCPFINPVNYNILRKRQAEFTENRCDLANDAERKAYADKIRQSMHDEQVKSDLAAYRQFELSGDINATMFALVAFQQINLSGDELPQIIFPRGRNAQRFAVRSESFHGGSLSDQWRTSITATELDLEYIATDKVEYPTVDLHAGNVQEEQNVLSILAEDMDFKFDALALAQIDAAKTTSGLRDLLSIHPNVKTANIPDTNYLDLTDVGTYGTAHKITLPRLKAILKHIVLFSAADPRRAIRPTSFIMSPQHAEDVWEFVDLVSGYDDSNILTSDPKNTVPTAVREEIFRTGAFTQAWGHTFNWQLNSSMDTGKLYIFTDQPLGWLFTKTEMDRTIQYNETNSPRHAEYSYGEVMFKRALRFYVPDLWKHHVVIVDF